MNKYQEDLDKIKNMGKKDLYNERHLLWANTLQELVDKEIPMKPYKWLEEAEWYDAFDEVEHYECPKCYNELCCPLKGTSITRCDKCGQAIGWGDTND